MNDLIYDHILSTQELTCTNCGSIGQIHYCDDVDASDEFYDKGWRGTKHGNLYCPVCVPKKLKGYMK